MTPAPSRHALLREPQFLLELPKQRLEGALGASIGSHIALGLLVLLLVRYLAPATVEQGAAIHLPDLVWLTDPRPGGGGGGGGNARTEPPRRAEIRRADPVPVERPPSEPPPAAEPPPIAPMPSRIPADAAAMTPGTLRGGEAASDSQGVGVGGGADLGDGRGIGPSTGTGVGPGAEAGTGGAAFRPGNGVTAPRLLTEVRPNYTAAAMRAKVQGLVRLECVVLPDGPSAASPS